MKRIILHLAASLVFYALCSTGPASLVAQPTGLMIKDNGDVGIGTLSPVGRLDVRSDGPDEGAIFTLGNADRTHYLTLFSGRTSDPNPFMLWKEGTPLRFGTDAGDFTELIRILPDGRVGIGLDNPATKLEVYGGGIFQAAQGGLGISPGSNYVGLSYRSTSGSYSNLYLKWAQAYFNGYVGIGTSNPQELLHVDDRIRIGYDPNYPSVYGELIHEGGGTGFRLNAHANGGWADIAFQTDGTTRMFLERAGKLGIGTTSPVTKLHIEGGVDASLTGHGFLVLGATTGHNVVIDNNEILARNNGAASELYLNNSGGNVHIPYTLLAGTVNIGTSGGASGYRLSVNGKMMAEELRIEDSGDWPDFIFDAQYPLLSLPNLEEYIQAHGHLPGIPNAADIAEEGFLVGDMQKRMMAKIEELTLYILQLYHENARLKDRISHMERPGESTQF